MRKAARVITVHNQNILVMKRNKFGQEYYCLVGGGIDPGETADQAAIRETYEEASLQIANLQLVYIEHSREPYGTQYIFTADYVDGDIAVQPHTIEAELNRVGKNTYSVLWVPVNKFAQLDFRSKELQAEILTALQVGFPKEPKTFTSHAEISYTRASKKEE